VGSSEAEEKAKRGGERERCASESYGRRRDARPVCTRDRGESGHLAEVNVARGEQNPPRA